MDHAQQQYHILTTLLLILLVHRIKGEFIGGCNDGPEGFGGVNTLNSNNKLDDMLKAAGAL
jgi:hypothetical protein